MGGNVPWERCGKLCLPGLGRKRLSHSDIYKPSYLFHGEVVFVYYFMGDKAEGYLVVLPFVHWIVELEVIDLHYKLLCVWG